MRVLLTNKKIMTQTTESKSDLHPIPMSELMSKPFPPSEWIVEELIPAGEITFISAYPGNFKTWLMLDIAVCAVQGIDFLGKFKTKKSKILIIDEESCEKNLQRRFKQLTVENALDIEILSFSDFNLSDTDKVISYCQERNIDVVMIDSLIRVHKLGDENSSTEMSKVFGELKKFKDKNISLIILHHNRKTGLTNGSTSAEDMRGSSEIFAGADCVLSLSKNFEGITICQTKLKADEERVPFLVKIERLYDGIKFEYLRDMEVEERKSKPQIAKEKIIELLKENGSLSKQEVRDLLPPEIKEYGFKNAFSQMWHEKLIYTQDVDGQVKFFLTTP